MHPYFLMSTESDNHVIKSNKHANVNFFALEGVDRSGKSTFLQEIRDALVAEGYEVETTREPGGTLWAEEARRIALYQEASPLSKLLMIHSGREDHVENLIKPYLEKGVIVLSDRFSMSAYSYQCPGIDHDKDNTGRQITELLESTWPVPNYIYLDISEQLWEERSAVTGAADKLDTEDLGVYRYRRTTYISNMQKQGGLFLTSKNETDYELKLKDTLAFIRSRITQKM